MVAVYRSETETQDSEGDARKREMLSTARQTVGAEIRAFRLHARLVNGKNACSQESPCKQGNMGRKTRLVEFSSGVSGSNVLRGSFEVNDRLVRGVFICSRSSRNYDRVSNENLIRFHNYNCYCPYN